MTNEKDYSKKILVLDDEEPALQLMIATLRELCPEDEIMSCTNVNELLKSGDLTGYDIAFVDIELGKINGIQFAMELKKHSPYCNIVFVTSYSQYGTEAFKTRPSGYVMKPYTKDDIRKELDNLRYPVEQIKKEQKLLRVETFGNVVVYKENGEAFKFSRTKGKELFAYLVDCGGYPVTTSDIACDMLEVDLDKQTSKNISKIIASLISDLEQAGYKDVVIKQNRQIYINKNKISCDLYDALNGDVFALNSFHGDYMIEYSWAEISESASRLREGI